MNSEFDVLEFCIFYGIQGLCGILSLLLNIVFFHEIQNLCLRILFWNTEFRVHILEFCIFLWNFEFISYNSGTLSFFIEFRVYMELWVYVLKWPFLWNSEITSHHFTIVFLYTILRLYGILRISTFYEIHYYVWHLLYMSLNSLFLLWNSDCTQNSVIVCFGIL